MICSPAPDLDRVSLLRRISGATSAQLAHRDQGQAEIADPGQQPVQRALIREQASDDRLRAVAADLEAAEPVRPPVIEDAVDADLVPGGTPWAAHACSSPRLAAIARPAPRRNCGSGRPGQARWHRSRPPHWPAASLPSLGTAIAILRSVGVSFLPAHYERPPGLGVTRRCPCGGIFRQGARHDSAAGAAGRWLECPHPIARLAIAGRAEGWVADG
jgi:hypothetical protein